MDNVYPTAQAEHIKSNDSFQEDLFFLGVTALYRATGNKRNIFTD